MKEVNKGVKTKTTSNKTKVKSEVNEKEKNISKKVSVKDKVKEKVKDIKKDNANKKGNSSFNLIEVIIIMIITAVFGILIGSCATYFRDEVEQPEVIPNSFKEFFDVYDDIVSEYYFDLNEEEMLEAGIKGMVDYLGDPYSSYLDLDSSNSLNLELEGEYVGMGATIAILDDGNLYISDMFKDSPAVKAGFKLGDRIIAVDGKSVVGLSSLEVSYKVKGPEGTSVDITVIRDGVEMTKTLTRGRVEIPSVTYHMLDSTGVGYVDISIFAKNTPDQFKNAMNELQKLGMKSVIIDVRDNNGGFLSSAEKIAGYFLKQNDVIYQLETKGVVEKVKNTNSRMYNLPVVVLTNGSSASASEIFTVSLKENIGAIVVGEKTYGKGTVQKAVQLNSGAMVKYTIQEWLSPKGNKIDGFGIVPDYEVKDGEFGDSKLEKALELLKK